MLPDGLKVCRFCGYIRGTTLEGAESSCLCDGIRCRYCGAGRIFRPISDHFEPDDGRFWHTPYFGSGVPCGACRRLGRRIHPAATSWPGPLRDDPELQRFIETLRSAAAALAPGRVGEGARPEGAGLAAFYGYAGDWRRIGLEWPPDGRPIALLRLSAPALAGWERGGLERGYWTYEGPLPLGAIEEALAERWNPAVRAR